MRKAKKYIAILLFAIWACFLTWALTFGSSEVTDMRLALRDYVESLSHHVEIEDVVMETKTQGVFAVEKIYSPTYTAVGDIDGDAGLRFEALDDTINYINKTTGSFRGDRKEQINTEGRIKITSKYDKDFEKIITVQFKKVYPEEFSALYTVKTSGSSAKTAYVGVPIYTSTSVKTSGYTEKDYTIEYDAEYFQQVSEYTLVPIKATAEEQTVSLRYVYGNGASAETKEFSIAEASDVDRIDEIKFGKNEEGASIKRSTTHTMALYTDGEKIHADYEVIAEDPDAIKITRGDSIQFLKAGKQTLTFRLPNGVSKTVTVDVYNIFEFPTITSPQANDSGVIVCKEGETVTFTYTFPKDVTYKTLSYEYNSKVISLSKGSNQFKVKGVKAGETVIKVVLDDGVEHAEATYRVQVKKNYNPLALLEKHKENIIGKGLGHMGGFAVLALLAANLARYVKCRRGLKKFIFCTCCGLIFSVGTEFAQSFIPNRSASATDVLLDLCGFYIGFLVACVLSWLVRYFKEKEKERD